MVLKNKLHLPSFDKENWTSVHRGLVQGFEPYEGASDANFTYKDIEGILTKELFGDDIRASWQNQ